jgi:hypothetical protein
VDLNGQRTQNDAGRLLVGLPARHDILPGRVANGGLECLPFGLFGTLGHLDQDALGSGTGEFSGALVPIFGFLEVLALHLAIDTPLNAKGARPAMSNEAPYTPNLGFL